MATKNKKTEINVNNALQHMGVSNTEEENNSSTHVDDKGLRMMKMMGYQSGFGLGKNRQGIVEPITVESQVDKKGLGMKMSENEENWDFSVDNPSHEEELKWLHCSDLVMTDVGALATWMKEDKPIKNIEKEYNFCDKDTLRDIIKAKNIFEVLDAKELSAARPRANPFETIRSVFFMNRASLKMANIDAATDFMFTNINENPFHKDHPGPYYFADVCAGPGGFTEYVLWRKSWQFKGFGFTLRGEHDFKLNESVCASPTTFLPLYGSKGDGNVCCPENIDDFKEKVLSETQSEGVHFMMSDGGFSVKDNEDLQEILSKKIYICQCLVALEILRKHGHFVTKMFDIFTCFSVGLLYLLCKSFEKVCILKPNSSRPANSERYVICSNFVGRENVQDIRIHIRKIVDRLWELPNDGNLDVTEIVPLSVLKNDSKFYSYIYNSNNRIAKYQTMNLQKLAAFCRNPSLKDKRQDELRSGCLKYWQIPDKKKVPLPKYTADDLLYETIQNAELLVQAQEICSFVKCEDILGNPQEWHYIPMQGQKTIDICHFYAGIGSSIAYKQQNGRWMRVKNLKLARGTLLYGEFVKEKHISKTLSEQQTDEVGQKYSLHVIDAIRLGDMNLTNLDFEERHKMICTYCEAINHKFRSNALRVRPKIVNRLDSPSSLFLTKDEISGNYISQLPVLGYEVKQEYFEVNSFLILRTSEESFNSRYVSRRQLFLDTFGALNETYLSLELLIHALKNMNS